MSWIPFCEDLPEKPEVLRIASMTGRSIENVCLALLRFWIWIHKQSHDGTVRDVSVTQLVTVVRDTDAQFWFAVMSVGWLLSGDGYISIPTPTFWAGFGSRKRFLATTRQRNYRDRLTHSETPVTQSVTRPHQQNRHQIEIEIENRREEPPLPPATPSRTIPDTKEAFARFWAAYPRKTGKQAAQKAFLKLKPDDELLTRILDALELHKQSRKWTSEPGFIPHPATWLNGRRWEDEHGPDGPAPSGPREPRAETTRQRLERIQAENAARMTPGTRSAPQTGQESS